MIQRCWTALMKRQRQIWAVDLEALVIVLLLMAECSVELRLKHPMRRVVDKVNENGGPYIGLVMAYPAEERALLRSGFCIPSSDIPFVDLAGRRFHNGKIGGIDVFYVMTGDQILNAGITVQILAGTFEIEGIFRYGTAGSVKASLSIADVSVPNYVAFYEFLEMEGKGENLLANIEFTPTQVFSIGKSMEEMFWLPIDSKWFNIASQLQEKNLERCVNDTYCLAEAPKVVFGLRGCIADIFVDNAGYRDFLFKQFSVSTVDEESAAIVMASLSNGVPCVVFRGVSDLAGGELKLAETSFSSLASVNALIAAVEFIKISGNKVKTNTYAVLEN